MQRYRTKRKVLCIDPGYSLKKALEMFESKNFPGHLLYGVNHLNESKLEIVLQPIGEGGRLANEIKAVRDYFFAKPDTVYLTFSDYGILLMILRKCRIIRSGIVALFHGYHEKCLEDENIKKKIKKVFVNIMRDIELSCVDEAVFISKYAYEEYLKKAKHIVEEKVAYISLQPEMICGYPPTAFANKYYLVSAGKTQREWEPLIEFAHTNKQFHITIICNNIEGLTEENLTIINEFTSFNKTLEFYYKASVIIVPVKESGGGVYGLSSLLDALAVRKPVLVSKTIGLGIDVDKLNIGRTYECNNYNSFFNALKGIFDEYDAIVDSINNFVKKYNIYLFGDEISKKLEGL